MRKSIQDKDKNIISHLEEKLNNRKEKFSKGTQTLKRTKQKLKK